MFYEQLKKEDFVEFALKFNQTLQKPVRDLQSKDIIIQEESNNEIKYTTVYVKNKFAYVVNDFYINVIFNNFHDGFNFMKKKHSVDIMWLQFMASKFGKEYKNEYKNLMSKSIMDNAENEVHKKMTNIFGLCEDDEYLM